jgi:protein phosphatase 4 regulatory subunit 3
VSSLIALIRHISNFFVAALKFFRNLIGLQDEFYNQQMTQGKLFGPVLDLLIETMPRDNLLNSACLEFFDFIKRENIKNLITHLVENYREKLKEITYVDIFSNFIVRYDQTAGFAPSVETSFLDTEEDTPKRPETGRGNRWNSGLKGLDAAEEEYFNTSDDEDDTKGKASSNRANGASPASKPLVDYTSDEENENMGTDITVGILAKDSNTPESSTSKDSSNVVLTPTSSSAASPPERLSEKRRREEDEDDDMSKLAQQSKRRSSVTSNSSSVLRRKKSFNNSPHGSGSGGKGNKIAISLSPAIKTGGEGTGGGETGS